VALRSPYAEIFEDDTVSDTVAQFILSSRSVSVDDFGAAGDGVTLDAAAIAAAIVRGTGGIVRFTPGKTYLTNQITVPSDTTLDMRGATILKNSRVVTLRASGRTNVTLLGGILDHAPGVDDDAGRHVWFDDCHGVRIEGLWVRGPQNTASGGSWATLFANCTDVTIDGYRQGDADNPACEDGLHFTGCQRVAVTNWVIHSGDDCIAINTQDDFPAFHTPTQDTYDISISNGVGRVSGGPGHILYIGVQTPSTFDIRNITVSNVVGACGNGTSNAFQVSNDAPSTSTLHDVTITNFFGDCDAQTSAAADGVVLRDANSLTMMAVNIVNYGRHGVEATDIDNAKFVAWKTDGSGTGAGIFLTGGSDGTQFVGCNWGASTVGINDFSSTNTQIVGCTGPGVIPQLNSGTATAADIVNMLEALGLVEDTA
jgi:hypothetical protein